MNERGRSGALQTLLRSIRRRRPLLTALLVVAAPVHGFLAGIPPLDLLEPTSSFRFVFPWILLPLGAAVRIWGSGNLRKNEEVTRTGAYALVRHPLYTGSLTLFLAYFLTVGDVPLGMGLFATLVVVVYYPTMLDEEKHLAVKFPDAASGSDGLPRLIPDPRRLGDALRSDRFSFGSARANLGFRSLAFVVALPAFLKLLALLHRPAG